MVSELTEQRIEEIMTELGTPSSFYGLVELKNWMHILLHYLCVQRINANPSLLKEVKEKLDFLASQPFYDPFFYDEWKRLLTSSSLTELYANTEEMHRLRINSPLHNLTIVSPEEKVKIVDRLRLRDNNEL